MVKNKDEFHQHGLIALWEASKRFDSKKGQFPTFAYAYIKGYLLMEMSKATKESERSIYPRENSGKMQWIHIRRAYWKGIFFCPIVIT